MSEYCYFINKDCKNNNNYNYTDYYIYSNDTDKLFHKKNEDLYEILGERKEHILSESQIIISKENCVGSDQLEFKERGVNMTSLKSKDFKNPDELCEFVNDNTYIQVVSINPYPITYQNVVGEKQELTNFILFYREDSTL